MSGIGDAADKAKQYAPNTPENVDQAKDKAQGLRDRQKGDGDQGGDKQPQ